MSVDNGNVKEPCAKYISMHEIAIRIKDSGAPIDFNHLFGELGLSNDELSRVNSMESFYKQIITTINLWVLKNTENNRRVGNLCIVFEKMKLIPIKEEILKAHGTDLHVCETCVVELKRRTESATVVELRSDEDEVNNNNEEDGHPSASDAMLNNASSTETITNATENCTENKHKSRRWILTGIAFICICSLCFGAYKYGKLSCEVTAVDPNVSRNSRTNSIEIDKSSKSKLVTEDDISNYNAGQYCKKQIQRPIRLHLGKLTSFIEPTSLNCLENIEQLNISGPFMPDALVSLLHYTTNLKVLSLYGMEQFCSYSEHFLADPVETDDKQNYNSVAKVVFHNFVTNCTRGINILSSILSTSNLFSIEITSSEFGDAEVSAIKKLVKGSPNLMYFLCCGEQCNKFTLESYGFSIFMEKNNCLTLHRSY